MAEDKNISFINSVIQQTRDNKLKWEYLDTNQVLYQGMGWFTKKVDFGFFSSKETLTPNFNVEDSFYVRIQDFYVVIYVRGDQPAQLFVVPNTYKKVVSLKPDEYGDYITQLLNLVQCKFPDASKFIDKFVCNKHS